jgi:hypothetical protein
MVFGDGVIPGGLIRQAMTGYCHAKPVWGEKSQRKRTA